MKYLRLPKSRMLRFGIFLLGTFLLSLAGLFGYRAWIFHRSHQQFIAVIEHLNATDPNWKLEDYFQSRPKIPDEENAWVYLQKLNNREPKNYKRVRAMQYSTPNAHDGTYSELDQDTKTFLDLNADLIESCRHLRNFERAVETEQNIRTGLDHPAFFLMSRSRENIQA